MDDKAFVTFGQIYPIGGIYISLNNVNPGTIFGGTWEALPSGTFLMNANSGQAGGDEIQAGLPNITGSDQMGWYGVHNGVLNNSGTKTGCFTLPDSYDSGNGGAASGSVIAPKGIKFDASLSNSIYGNSTTVQPHSIVVFMWKRIA